MNTIILKGVISNISPSHNINGTEFWKADLTCNKYNGDTDLIQLRFKRYSCPYQDGQEVELKGNIRSYSEKQEDGSNKVNIYVFTYFDIPEETNEDGTEIINLVQLDGRICKIDELRKIKNGKDTLHFILANNIFSEGNKQKLNNYIPICCWGKTAKNISNLQVSDMVELKGQLHSRMYKKTLENGEIEFKVAYEVVPSEIYQI